MAPRLRRARLALAPSILALCGLTLGCTAPEPEETGAEDPGLPDMEEGEEGAAEQPLVGGTAAVNAPGAVGQVSGCTATLVDPRFVLTAGHCLPGSGPRSDNFNYANAAANVTVEYGHQHWNPYITSSGYEYDLGVVRLAQPAVAALPAPIAPGLPANGTSCMKYGAGCQDRGTQQGGGALQQLGFTWPQSYANCPGDSGGPAFCGGQVAGINSGYWIGSGLDITAHAYQGVAILNAVRTLGTPTVHNTPLATFAGWASAPGVKIVSGDFDGGSGADLALLGGSGWTTIPVALNSSGNPISWSVTNASAVNFAIYATQARGAVVGDFNGDGKDDIALHGGQWWTTIPVAFSNGNGTFNVTNLPQEGDMAHWWNHPDAKVAAGDIDADGDDDLIISGVSGWGTLPAGRSSGNGTFVPVASPAGSFPGWATTPGSALLAGDFNGDGADDVALTGPSGWSTIPVAYSKFDGTWNVQNHSVAYFPEWVTAPGVRFSVGDYDGDGDDDIGTSGGQGWVTALFALSSREGFEAANLAVPDFPLWASVATMLSGDFDQDGRDDLALAGGPGWASVPVLTSSPAVSWLRAGDAQWGTFSASDPQLGGKAVDDYYFTADLSTPVSVSLTRSPFNAIDPVVQVLDTTTWAVIAQNDDDAAMYHDSRLSFTPVRGRTYVLRATTYSAGVTGDYRIMVAQNVAVKGESYTGTLVASDGKHPSRKGRFTDDLLLVPTMTGSVTIQLSSSAFDTYLEVHDENTGLSLAVNDDCPSGGLNSCVTLGMTDRWPLIVRVSSYSANSTGSYTVTFN